MSLTSDTATIFIALGRNQNIPLINLEQFVPEDLLLQAEELVDNNARRETHEIAKGHYRYVFLSDEQAIVEIRCSSSHIELATCDCRLFLQDGVCAHTVAAALLCRSDHTIDRSDQGQSGTPSKEYIFDDLSTNTLLRHVDPRSVVEFVRKQVRQMPQLKLALKASLIREVTFRGDLNKYDLLLKQSMPFNIHGKLALSKREIAQIHKTCQVLLGYLDESLALHQYEEALSLIEALLKRLHILRVRSEHSREQTEALLVVVYKKAIQFSHQEMSPKLRERLFRFGCELSRRPSYLPVSFQANIFQVIYPLHADRHEANELVRIMQEIYDRSADPMIKAVEWHISQKILPGWNPDQKALHLADSTLNSVFQILVKYHLDRLLLDLSYVIDQQRFTSRAEQVKFNLTVLNSAIRSDRKTAVLRAIANLLGGGEDRELLDTCVKAFGTDWPAAAPFLHTWCDTRLSISDARFVHALLYTATEEWDPLFDTLLDSRSMQTVLPFASYLFHVDRSRSETLFVDVLSREIEDHLGPKLNFRILDALQKIEEQAGQASKMKITEKLLERFPERISLNQALLYRDTEPS